MTDITKHAYVPKHEKLAPEQAEEVFKTYNINRRQLPTISPKDPALKGMEAAVGDVIKITRSSTTNGEALFFRIVQ